MNMVNIPQYEQRRNNDIIKTNLNHSIASALIIAVLMVMIGLSTINHEYNECKFYDINVTDCTDDKITNNVSIHELNKGWHGTTMMHDTTNDESTNDDLANSVINETFKSNYCKNVTVYVSFDDYTGTYNQVYRNIDYYRGLFNILNNHVSENYMLRVSKKNIMCKCSSNGVCDDIIKYNVCHDDCSQVKESFINILYFFIRACILTIIISAVLIVRAVLANKELNR